MDKNLKCLKHLHDIVYFNNQCQRYVLETVSLQFIVSTGELLQVFSTVKFHPWSQFFKKLIEVILNKNVWLCLIHEEMNIRYFLTLKYNFHYQQTSSISQAPAKKIKNTNK